MANFLALMSWTPVIVTAQSRGSVWLLFHFQWHRRCSIMSQASSECKFWDVITHKQGYCKWQQWSIGGYIFVHTHQPPWFYCAERLSSVISLPCHDFCYVDVVTQEHPRVRKHTDMGLITCTHSCVLGISVPSNVAQWFTADDLSDPTISTLLPKH